MHRFECLGAQEAPWAFGPLPPPPGRVGALWEPCRLSAAFPERCSAPYRGLFTQGLGMQVPGGVDPQRGHQLPKVIQPSDGLGIGTLVGCQPLKRLPLVRRWGTWVLPWPCVVIEVKSVPWAPAPHTPRRPPGYTDSLKPWSGGLIRPGY